MDNDVLGFIGYLFFINCGMYLFMVIIFLIVLFMIKESVIVIMVF